MDIKDIPAGESWGCRFRTTTFLDKEGTPVTSKLSQHGASTSWHTWRV